MDRRAFVQTAGGGVAVALAGCLTRENDEEEPDEPEDEGELRIATRSSMVRGEEPAAEWLREAFEEAYPDAEIVWTVPEAGIELYVQQLRGDVELGADLYVGLTVPDLVAVDAALGERRLFEPVDRNRLAHTGHIQEDLTFDDPRDRTLPFATNYLAIVYDGSAVEPPETFADLLEADYEGELLVPDARTSRTGLAFLLWTISAFGEEGALDYWRDLAANDVRIVRNWADAYYGAYADGEGSAIVGYSTARVSATVNGWEADRHQVAFPEGGSYEALEGVGVFAESRRTELAYDFVDFLLSGDAQAAVAARGGRFPAVDEAYVDTDERFTAHARRPIERSAFAYEDLAGRTDEWVESWAEAVDV